MIISFILEQTLLKGFSTNRLQVLFLGSRLCGEIRTHNVGQSKAHYNRYGNKQRRI